MKITPFTKEHCEEARRIVRENYEEERCLVTALPNIDHIPDLTRYADNGLGVAAFEDGRMVGFLCGCDPWENAFDSPAIGTFSPLHAHGAVSLDKGRIYQRLYQAAAREWVTRKITYHGIMLFAHDETVLGTFFRYGFGLRCVDSIRTLDPIECPRVEDMTYQPLPKAEVGRIRNLRRNLSDYLGDSPCFLYSSDEEYDAWLKRAENRDSQVYIAVQGGIIVAYVEIQDEGENFVTRIPDMKNVCGAFCLPEHRGKGVLPNLLNFAMGELKNQGFARLGVDFESYNPSGSSAWNKHFVPYTHSVVRRIDEGALRKFGYPEKE